MVSLSEKASSLGRRLIAAVKEEKMGHVQTINQEIVTLVEGLSNEDKQRPEIVRLGQVYKACYEKLIIRRDEIESTIDEFSKNRDGLKAYQGQG